MFIKIHKNGIAPKYETPESIGANLCVSKPLALDAGLHDVKLNFDITLEEGEIASVFIKKKLAKMGATLVHHLVEDIHTKRFSLLLDVRQSIVLPAYEPLATMIISSHVRAPIFIDTI